MWPQLIRDRRGNIAVLSSLMLTSLVGVGGLVAEFGNGLLNKMQDQRVADSAAMAGAIVYSSSGSSSSMQSVVSNLVALNGLSATAASAQLVSSPSGDGNQAVAVTVQTSVPLLLSKVLWSRSTLPVSVTSYAELKPASGGSGCILALDTSAHQAITVSGSANVQAPNCNVVANSNNSDALDMSGSAAMTTPCTITVGGQDTTSGLTLTSCTSPKTNAAATPDPYASLPWPSNMETQTCQTMPTSGAVPSGYYCHGINASGTYTFSGTYYVKGNLSFQGGSNISGSNATFFIDKSGTTAISGSAVVNLSAPTTGTYAGILFFGDRAGTTANNNNISGASSSVLTGAMYYPTQKVTYSGGSSSPSNCTQVIGDTITFSGSTYVGDNCSGTGVASINSLGSTVAALMQ